MEREADDARWKALLDAIRETQRVAYHTAGTVAAWVINVNLGKDAERVTAFDIFPFLRPDGAAVDAPAEMTTAETVEHLKQGFGLYVPTRFRQAVGLPD
jgi:hypothetical protein